MRRLVVLLVLTALATAGCLGGPQGDNSTYGGMFDANDSARPDSASSGTMTSTDAVKDSVDACSGGSGGTHCAKRIITIEGTMRGVVRLPVELETFNGDIEVVKGPAGAWSMVATIRARGDGEAEARQNLENVAFTWAHEGEGQHFLTGVARLNDRNGNGYGAELKITLPPGVTLVATVTSTNGDVSVDADTSGASLRTTNGDVSLTGRAAQVDLTTTNGEVDARLTPSASGRIRASSTNGDIDLELTESATHGYDASGSTSRGEVTFSLRDGSTSGDKPTQRAFRTNDYDARAIQTAVTLSTTNGDIDVSPR